MLVDLGPQHLLRIRVGENRMNPNPLGIRQYTALDDGRNGQIGPDLGGALLRAPKRRDRAQRNHPQVSIPRQNVDELLRQTVGNVAETRVRAAERQHRYTVSFH